MARHPRTEAEALRDDTWRLSARPEIRRLMDSLLGVTQFLDLAATSPVLIDLGPALDHIENTLSEIRRATNTPRRA